MKMDQQHSISLVQHTVASDVLNNERMVWLQPPADGVDVDHAKLAVFLDGEYYLPHVGAPSIMHTLQKEKALPPMWCAYVAARTQAFRWPESFCNPDFVSFICDELVPTIEAHTGASGARLIAGLSLTGLSAAHTALSRPDVFHRVLCQSGSFWWENGRLPAEVGNYPPTQAMFRITVGDQEIQTNVEHGSGLTQVMSQVEANERMRDALLNHGCRVSYHRFNGGHDIGSWRRNLADDLRSLFSDP